MAFEVRVAALAAADIEQAVRWLAENYDPNVAGQWRSGLLEALATLAHMPRRCPIAPEQEVLQSGELRNLVYKNYRIIFTLSDTDVVVLHVRHMARDQLGTYIAQE